MVPVFPRSRRVGALPESVQSVGLESRNTFGARRGRSGVAINTSSWATESWEGRASDLQERVVGLPATRSVTVCRVSAPAIVLGSSQLDSDVDRQRASSAGVEVVRRQSGGGAVLIVPGQVAWVEVTIGHDDRLWSPDVGRACWWVGEAWARALSSLGINGSEVHRGAMGRARWSDPICFAGTGPGEVFVHGQKVVGLSQRRSRDGARFECAALLSWAPDLLIDLLALGTTERRVVTEELSGVAAGIGNRASIGEVEQAFIGSLP